ncbi:B3 domain-containing protein REM5-like [Impatiens glandulifera]|uniref:B3 domain-containing protein REM5-like n=1 Tax=Impatiens glandulifera TaxID=253017 RepID=UPI001FB12345|nr:B3 domain-containing protein REM5-like [Impatiens glandulifera]
MKRKFIPSATTPTSVDNSCRRRRLYDPHFFQPLLPGFRRRLKIPEEFMSRYLDEELNKKKKKKKVCESSYSTPPVLLRSHNKEWVVHLRGGRYLQKGWTTFVDQYFDDDDDDNDNDNDNDNDDSMKKKMDVGDIIIFKHKGDLIFDVSVFDATTCCQKLPNLNTQDHHQSPLINNSKKKNPGRPKKEKPQEQEQKPYTGKKRKAADSVCPYFDTQLKLNSNILKKTLYVPVRFVRANGLERNCKMILKDDIGREWEVEATLYPPHSYLYVSNGWNDFQIGNGLKVKDCFRFQIIKNGPIPVLLFSRLPRKTKKKKKDGNDDDTRRKKKKKKEDGDDDTRRNNRRRYTTSALTDSRTSTMKTKTISATASAGVTAASDLGYDPHFFQPLLPGFLRSGINIPEAFMMRYLNEELKKDLPVMIRKHNREWEVHLRGRRLEKGWPEFVVSYYSFPDSGDKKKMDVGDIVIFKHKGNLVFEVSVYDATTSLEKLPYHRPNKDNNQSINKKRKKNEMMKSK